jgi:poly(3-hydroxybutyrate) depolymerase
MNMRINGHNSNASGRARPRSRKLLLGAGFAVGFVVVPLVVLAIGVLSGQPQPSAAVDYAKILPGAVRDLVCSARPEQKQDELIIENGLKMSVRAPANYDHEIPHPLLVAFPPGGYGRRASEDFYAITTGATARGFVVVFPAARPLSRSMIKLYSKISEAVAGRWCVDTKRVAFVGHSDGASAAYGISLLERGAIQPRAILVSAAGLNGNDLASNACPSVKSVMIVQGRKDALFPDYGRQASLWWGQCFKCDTNKFAKVSPHCLEAQGCQGKARLVFCATNATHEMAPEIANFELDFLQQRVSADK